MHTCRRLGLSVPQQIAVLGVDNEDFICRHVKPPLSSVARNNHQEGYRAAAVLDRLMQGKSVSPVELIRPAGVVERESTDVIAVADDRVRKALDYVKRQLDSELDVNKVARHVDVSRRWLEYAFRDAVGESPYQYIRNRRLEWVGRLLAEDRTMKIAEIARRTGFTSAKQLTMSFQQWCGMSPRDYRRSLQPGEVAAASSRRELNGTLK
jgi:LacI family transcriptional regulator